MKKLFLICLLFACNLLYANEKKILEKSTKYSYLLFCESDRMEEESGYKYFTRVREDDLEGGELLYLVLSNEYDKIKNFTTAMYKSGIKIQMFAFYFDYYETLHDDLTLEVEDTKISDNKIIDSKLYILE